MPRSSELARLSRATGALQLAVLIGWLLWWAPRSTVTAVAGALVLLAIGPVTLAVEFVLLVLVQRGDPGIPKPTLRELARSWAGETREMYRVFYWRQPLRWRDPPDLLPQDAQGRQGVVFIHGFVCNRGFWAPWLRRLRARGQPCIAINLEPVFAPIGDYTPLVEDAVRRITACTGRPPILVCHSMGGIVARSWLRDMRAGERIARLVTLCSPHHGTWLGRFSRRPNGLQMRLQSTWLRQLEADEAALPQPPRTCWYTNCDNIVFPASTASLPGADNRLVRGFAHVQMAFTPAVMDAVLDALSAGDPVPSR
ncbi:alpha/beta fold hydrolase [Ramlibacter sp. G-1-2-2]|uniref:Alpha/beta fold hydrolase n=1 Tax=Ramlibacter agri TaxID=2728837 RepID=A0A848H8X2_9BURK|nr:alpha/beta fold hydrolase [Ramlibacter agri]NML46937.1 alpha/beta fold hydrolase [Ramlibacter agri]